MRSLNNKLLPILGALLLVAFSSIVAQSQVAARPTPAQVAARPTPARALLGTPVEIRPMDLPRSVVPPSNFGLLDTSLPRASANDNEPGRDETAHSGTVLTGQDLSNLCSPEASPAEKRAASAKAQLRIKAWVNRSTRSDHPVHRDDLAQLAMQKVLKACEEILSARNRVVFAYVVVRNEVRAVLGAANSRARCETSDDTADLPIGSEVATIEALDARLLISKCLASLSDNSQLTFYRAYVLGMTDVEIAGLRGCRSDTVKKERKRIVERCKQAILASGYEN